MADIKRKVPNLRFKGFTDDWEQRKLGELVTSYDTKRMPIRSEERMAGPYPYYGATGIIDYVNNYIFDGKYLLLAEDGANIIDRTAPITYLTNGKFWLNNHAHIMNSTKSNLVFLKATLDRKNYIKFNTGTAQPKLNAKIVANLKLNLPVLAEQDKISKVISRIEIMIALQQRKLALLKQLKKGLLQKMFADKGSKRPILRFEGFNDDWEGRKLENSADYIRGSFPQPYGNKEWYGGTNAKPFVQVVDVNTNMRLNKKTKEQISVLAQPKSRFVPSDSIVVTLQGSIGRVAITQYDSYVDRTLLIFTKYKVPVDKYFWAYSIQNIFRIEKQKAPGGTIKTITKRALSSFEVSLPVQEEQKKIGTLLKNIDDIITSQQEEVTKLKKIKKSLLQQMFI